MVPTSRAQCFDVVVLDLMLRIRRVMRKPFELDDLIGEVLACGGGGASAEAH
jgi:hypothetical protein